MRTGTRITRNNIHLLADEVGMSAKDLYDEMVDAKLAFKREQDKKWSCAFFGKDERWYDETMQKIWNIRDMLPEDVNPKEATIKMYGWIEKNRKKKWHPSPHPNPIDTSLPKKIDNIFPFTIKITKKDSTQL